LSTGSEEIGGAMLIVGAMLTAGAMLTGGTILTAGAMLTAGELGPSMLALECSMICRSMMAARFW
jgi:hypothetical protein